MGEYQSVLNYVIKRCLMAIPLMFAIIIMSFLLIHLVPGDPIHVFLGGFAASPEYTAMMRERMGLDKPVFVQLLVYIQNILRGDLGTSYLYFMPVSSLILSRIGNTLILVALSMIWSTFVGVLLGVLSARKPFSLTDNVISLVSVLGYSVPYFWLGMMLIMFFSVRLDILPLGGLMTLGIEFDGLGYVVDRLRHLVLPSFALGIFQFAVLTRLTRASLQEVLRQDFIMMAWSKGLRERTVLLKHGLRNAILPVVTILGLRLGTAFGGAILTETVFSYPGIGRLMYDALVQRDFPIIMGILIMISFTVIMANLVVDVLYIFIDPRVKHK